MVVPNESELQKEVFSFRCQQRPSGGDLGWRDVWWQLSSFEGSAERCAGHSSLQALSWRVHEIPVLELAGNNPSHCCFILAPVTFCAVLHHYTHYLVTLAFDMWLAPHLCAIVHLSSHQMAPQPPLCGATFWPSRATNHWQKHNGPRFSFLFAHLHCFLLNFFWFSFFWSSFFFSSLFFSSHDVFYLPVVVAGYCECGSLWK